MSVSHWNEYLKPLLEKSEQEKVGVFDIESWEWTKFQLAASYDGKEVKFHDSIDSLTSELFNFRHRGRVWYAHNGGRFDFLFLLQKIKDERHRKVKLITRGSSIISIRVQDSSRHTTELRDSLAILPDSLKRLSESFDTEVKKSTDLNFEKERFEKTNPIHVQYLKQDVVSLYQVIKKFQEMPFIKEVGSRLTAASTSIAAWRSTIKTPIRVTPKRVQDFVRESYAGGRTEIFKTEIMGGSCLDVNSLYPFCMLKSLPCEFVSESKDVSDFGFHKVTIQVPECHIPILWVKTPKLIFPTGVITGTFFSEEINLALRHGAKILKFHEGCQFSKSENLFKEYINTLYALRLKYPDSAISYVAKLLANSCYGKTGEREKKKSVYIADYENPKSWPKNAHFWRDVNTFKKVGIMEKVVEKRSPHMLAHIASAVTAHARIHMAENYYLPYESSIAYTDTDSLFTDEKLRIGQNIGELKEEYKIKYGCFILPKGYLIIKENGDKITKLKGFPKKYLKTLELNDFKNNKFEYSEKSHLLTMRQAIIQKNEYLAVGDIKKSLKAIYDKRQVLPSGETRAWKLIGGELK